MVLGRPTRPRTNTQKRCPFHHRGVEFKSRKSRDTWSNRQVWPGSTKWSRAKANRVLLRDRTGHSKHHLPTTQETTLHMDITIIQVYALTTNAEEAEWFYEDLQHLLEVTPKDVLFIIGDWNAKVGGQETPGVRGKFGLGVRNEAGQRLIEFCQRNTLVIANTFFQQHKRRLYTWTSPNGQHRNQIDSILCIQRWRSSIQSTKQD